MLSSKYERQWKLRAATLTFIFMVAFFSFLIGLAYLKDRNILPLLLSGTAMFAFIKVRKKWKLPKDDGGKNIVDISEGKDGTAEWATWAEMEQVNNPDQNIMDGLWIGGGFIRSKWANYLTIGGAGLGKGSNLLIHNLLMRPYGSIIGPDIKGELACITAKAQKYWGQKVYIIDPWNVQKEIGATHGIEASGFNPFSYLKANPEELQDNVEAIAFYLCPDRPNDKDPFWVQRSRQLIKICLLHILTFYDEEQQSFWTLYKLLRKAGTDWQELMIEMQTNDALDGLISVSAGEFASMPENGNTLTGIKSQAHASTAIFESPQLRASLTKNDFNPFDLTNGDVTVYFVLPERFVDTHAAWLRLCIGLCLKACNARPNKRVNFFLDEFPILGKFTDIQRGYAFSRGQNISLWTFVQSLSQLKEIYGEGGMNSFIANTNVLQAFGGIKDQYTREIISKLLGVKTQIKFQQSFNKNVSGPGLSENWSYSSNPRELLKPDEVGSVDGIITICDGLKYIIPKMPYYKNRFEGVSPDADWLTPEQSRMLREGKLPPDPFHERLMELADPPPRIIK